MSKKIKKYNPVYINISELQSIKVTKSKIMIVTLPFFTNLSYFNSEGIKEIFITNDASSHVTAVEIILKSV
jgi:hypothetical protein